MTHALVLDLIVSIVPACGATGFAILVYRMLGTPPPPPPDGDPPGGAKVPLPRVGPDDLARSA